MPWPEEGAARELAQARAEDDEVDRVLARHREQRVGDGGVDADLGLGARAELERERARFLDHALGGLRRGDVVARRPRRGGRSRTCGAATASSRRARRAPCASSWRARPNATSCAARPGVLPADGHEDAAEGERRERVEVLAAPHHQHGQRARGEKLVDERRDERAGLARVGRAERDRAVAEPRVVEDGASGSPALTCS